MSWVGYAVSVSCGSPLGCYQGTILDADGSTITLTKAFRNGFPYPKSQVTLNATDIKELKIIESKMEGKQTHSTVALAKNKRNRAPVADILQDSAPLAVAPPEPVAHTVAQPEPVAHTVAQPEPEAQPASVAHTVAQPAAPAARSMPVDIQGGARQQRRLEHARRRNDACFGASASPALQHDFDFEGNLALFDRAALREKMRGVRPDLLRHAGGLASHLRPDQNVLPAPPAPPRWALRVPDEARAGLDYATDGGARLAAAGVALRRRLWLALERLGVADEAGVLLARAAADVCLRLAGGPRRLEPRNAHQAPRVAVLAGAHRCGAAALMAARLLAAHGAAVSALAPPPPHDAATRRALAACALGDVALVSEAGALAAADVVLLALHDPAASARRSEPTAALRWAAGARAALVLLEPAAEGGAWEALRGRAALQALAPGALAARLGRLYLCNVCAPGALYAAEGVQYWPPFGAESVLALHAADD